MGRYHIYIVRAAMLPLAELSWLRVESKGDSMCFCTRLKYPVPDRYFRGAAVYISPFRSFIYMLILLFYLLVCIDQPLSKLWQYSFTGNKPLQDFSPSEFLRGAKLVGFLLLLHEL